MNNNKVIENINKRINNEICFDTLNKLKDENLMEYYKNSNSVKKEIIILQNILKKNKINEDVETKILNEYLIHLIPAGTKGVIRGNIFNKIVKQSIENLNLDNDRFEICFEKQCILHITEEIPDWYICEKKTKKIIIGMNQLDLIGGGQQINRGYKYLINNIHNTEQSKLLCVIANYTQFKKNNKKTKLFETGFNNNTLTYLNNLHNIINIFFN